MINYFIAKTQAEQDAVLFIAKNNNIWASEDDNWSVKDYPVMFLDGATIDGYHNLGNLKADKGVNNIKSNTLTQFINLLSKKKTETIVLNDNYKATYTEGDDFVCVGCQKFPITAIEKLYKAIKS